MPAFSEELQQAIEEKKVVLGGCCITDNDPARLCQICRRKYGASYLDTKVSVQQVSFNIGGFHEGYHELVLIRRPEGGVAKYRNTLFSEKDPMTMDMDERSWDRFIDALFKCLIMDWKRNYKDPGCLDGTQWSLELQPAAEKAMRIHGSNNFPPKLYWSRLLKAMSRIGFGEIG